MKELNTRNYIRELLSEAVAQSDGSVPMPIFSLGDTPNPDFGDYATNLPMLLTKTLRAKPKDVADGLIANLRKLDTERESIFLDVYEKSGFINFRLTSEYFLKVLEQIHEQGGRFGSSMVGQSEKLMVEYFQNNVAKPPHVGHLRSAVIGDSLKRIFLSLGFDTISDTHIGDWGTQFGILLYAFKIMGDGKVIDKDPITELNSLYVAMSKKIEEDPSLQEKGKEEFAKLEKGDAKSRELWQWFVDVSKKDFEKYQRLLGLLPFEHNDGESFYEDKMKDVLLDLKKENLLLDSEGAQIVNLEDKKLGIAVVVKSDGATTYLLRDLATLKHRITQLKLFKILYVVDNRQAHHFEQVFEIALRLGFLERSSNRSLHIDFGFMSLPQGPISTRKGTTISLQKLIDEAEKRALAIIQEKNPTLKSKEVVSKQVALAAIKYFDLSHNRKSDTVFRWDEVLDFEGNSGPYLQYAYVRVSGIERKLGKDISKARVSNLGKNITYDATEMKLMRKLAKFPEVVTHAANEYMPHYICGYLYELAHDFNSFYEAVWVLKEKDSDTKNFRLALIRGTAQVLKNGLELLGIEAPEEM